MFCPNCGSNNSTEQKFCRSCGINLEQTAQSLLEQIPSSASAGLIKQRQKLEKFGDVVFTGFAAAILLGVIGLIYVTFTKMVLAGNNPAAGIVLILIIIFATLALAYVFMNETLKEKSAKLSPELAKELEPGRETGKLLEEGNFEPAASSVTDRTTELLYTENKTKGRD